MLFSRHIRYMLNDDAINFLLRNGVTSEDISKIDKNLRRIVESYELDSITKFVQVYSLEEIKMVSIADILGYDYPKNKDLFGSISEFFDSQGDGYHSRSVGMLEYSSDEVLEKLQQSFKVEPMMVKEIRDGHYLIDTNGMHRFTVLRMHYLLEKFRGKSDDELRDKFMISVMSKKLDVLKTYCAYIVKLLDDSISIRSEFDENYRKTGRVLIEDTSKRKALDDEELILYTTEIIKVVGIDVATLIRLSIQIDTNLTFLQFLSSHFPELMNEIERFEEYKKNCAGEWDVYEFKSSLSKKESSTWSL